MNVEIAAVAEVDRLWPMIAADVQRACRQAPELLTAGELWQMCRSGNAFLYIIHDGAVIHASAVMQFEGDAYRVWSLSGRNLSAWLTDFFESVRATGKENGAARLVCRGRRGWLRLIKGSRENGDDYEVDI